MRVIDHPLVRSLPLVGWLVLTAAWLTDFGGLSALPFFLIPVGYALALGAFRSPEGGINVRRPYSVKLLTALTQVFGYPGGVLLIAILVSAILWKRMPSDVETGVVILLIMAATTTAFLWRWADHRAWMRSQRMPDPQPSLPLIRMTDVQITSYSCRSQVDLMRKDLLPFWLKSPRAEIHDVTGRVFEVTGVRILRRPFYPSLRWNQSDWLIVDWTYREIGFLTVDQLKARLVEEAGRVGKAATRNKREARMARYLSEVSSRRQIMSGLRTVGKYELSSEPRGFYRSLHS